MIEIRIKSQSSVIGGLENVMNNYEPAIDNFALVAKKFCEWVEQAPSSSEKELLKAQALLSELSLAAVRLPEMEFDEEHQTIPVSPEAWTKVCERFSNLPVQGHWLVFNPLKEEAPVFGSLADDFADIYSDIKEYFQLYEAGHVTEAVWHWRFNFQIHWGSHLLAAQRAIHHYLYYS